MGTEFFALQKTGLAAPTKMGQILGEIEFGYFAPRAQNIQKGLFDVVRTAFDLRADYYSYLHVLTLLATIGRYNFCYYCHKQYTSICSLDQIQPIKGNLVPPILVAARPRLAA